jgi:hypothetical protein
MYAPLEVHWGMLQQQMIEVKILFWIECLQVKICIVLMHMCLLNKVHRKNQHFFHTAGDVEYSNTSMWTICEGSWTCHATLTSLHAGRGAH